MTFRNHVDFCGILLIFACGLTLKVPNILAITHDDTFADWQNNRKMRIKYLLIRHNINFHDVSSSSINAKILSSWLSSEGDLKKINN